MIHDDEKYKSLRDSLKSLPKLRAKKDFEARLFQRIRESEKGVIHAPVKKAGESVFMGWLSNLFRPSLVPALGLTAVLLITVVVYFAYFSGLNDSGTEDSRQMTSTKNQGDLVIYVKKDIDSISSIYPREYSAITPSETGRERDFAPTEIPSDFLSRPETPAPTEGIIKPDRVSEEQSIEMQRRSDIEKKDVETKSERKSDDVIMKKESKGDLKRESEKSPYNIRDEKNNEDLNGQIKQEEKVAPKVEPKVAPKGEDDSSKEKLKNEKKNEGNDKSESELKDTNRIGKTAKDSTEHKKDVKIESDENK
jgi:hypothetical protein